MKKILFIFLTLFSLNATELPSFQCIETYYTSFIEADGSIKPKIRKPSAKSKLNIMVETGKNNKYFLNVNGGRISVAEIKNGYIYAVEFTGGGMNTWVFLKNKKNKKYYLTISKTYELMDAPLTLFILYSCEQVNNSLQFGI